eukprot:g10029.t1
MPNTAFAEWFIGDFLPFGDLVSDIWLWSTLPQDKPDSYNCSETAYKVMRKLLVAGTIVDGIPEFVVVLALLAGLIVGGVSLCKPEQRKIARSIVSRFPGFARYAFADGKATADFLINRTRRRSSTWFNTMELVGWYALVSLHIPVLLPFCSVSPASRKYQYVIIVAVQLVAGALTEAASVFFAIMGGETVSIFSAWFGFYSLVMSTTVAVWRGENADDAELPTHDENGSEARRADEDDIDLTGCGVWKDIIFFVAALIPVVLFGGGVGMVMWGVSFFASVGAGSFEAWLLVLPGGLLAVCGVACTQCTTYDAMDSHFHQYIV